MKKSIRFAFLFLAIAMLSIFVACKPKEPTVNYSLNISEESVEIAVGQEVEVDVVLENLEGEVVWEVTDPSIATVNAGVVTGVSVGQTTIKAKIGEYEDSCIVNVITPSVVGTLSVDYETISLNEGAKINVNASVTFNNAKVEGLTYVWSENSNSAVISLNAEGSKCEVTAIGYGEAIITVKTNHLGVDLTKTINVTVVRDISVEITNLELGEKGYNLALVTYVPTGLENQYINEYQPEIEVVSNGTKLENPVYSLSTESDVVEITGNKIKALKTGEAQVVLKYEDESGSIVYLDINVIVSTTDIKVDEMIDFDKDANLVVLDKQDYVGNITSVTLGEEELAFEVVENEIRLSGYQNASTGENVLVVKTENANYELKAFVVTMVIDSKEDLDRLGSVSKVGDTKVWDGYYVLGCDIEYNAVFTTFCGYEQGGTWGGDTGFVGTLDGRGHVIKGLKIDGAFGGLIGTIGTNGVVKNLGFIDAEIKDSADRSGIVASFVYGKIQNVFVQVKQNGAWWCGGVAEYVYPSGEISNTIVYVTETNGRADILALTSFSFDDAILKNCYSVGALPLYRSGGDNPVAGVESETLKNFTSLADMKAANVDLTSWDSSVWDTTSGMPVYKGYLEYIKENTEVSIKNDNTVKVTGSLTIDGSNDYVYSLKEEIDGITINGNVVTVVRNYDVKFTVVATNIIDSTVVYEKEFTVASKPTVDLVDSYNIKIDNLTSTITITDISEDVISKVLFNDTEITFTQEGSNLTLSNYQALAIGDYTISLVGLNANYQGTISVISLPYNIVDKSVDLDMSTNQAVLSKDDYAGTISSVKLGDSELTFEISGTDILISGYQNSTLGTQALVIRTDEAIYELKALVVTKVINSTDDWTAVLNNKTDGKILGYYVLGNDIDYDSVSYGIVNTAAWGSTAGFDGIFDGRGYTISNLTLEGDGLGFFGTICLNAVIRNVEFKNATIAWGGQGGVLGNLVYGEIENVAISFTSKGGWWNGAIGCFIRSEAKINNVMISVTGTAGDSSSAIGSCIQDAAVITNCYAVGTLPLAYVGADAPGAVLENGTNVAKYDSLDLLGQANHDLSGWDTSIWDVTAGYPVFK